LSGGDGPDRWLLWLEAVLGGGVVEGFHLISMPAGAHVDRRCRRLPPTTTVEIPKRLALGMPDSVVKRMLGLPSAVVADTLIYRYVRDEVNDLVFVLEQGRVVQIAAWIAPM
jgi:hypothetical protein